MEIKIFDKEKNIEKILLWQEGVLFSCKTIEQVEIFEKWFNNFVKKINFERVNNKSFVKEYIKKIKEKIKEIEEYLD